MESAENKALNLLTRLKDREQSKEIATEMVKNIFLYKNEKDKSFFECNHKKYLLKIRKLTNKFRKVNNGALFIRHLTNEIHLKINKRRKKIRFLIR